MIPILYSGSDTSFTTNGLGRLTDIIECVCTEERNGIYEVEFTYPITGKYYQRMVNMVEAYATGNWNNCGVIGCIHDDKHDIQPFDLYSVSSPIDGVATFNAHHISYRLGREVVTPFSATSAADAMSQLPTKIKGGSLFTFWTDKATGGSFNLDHPENVRNILGGQAGSLLDCFGSGEYEFDKFAVKLYQNRGVNTGATIRYGKNMTDITRDIDSSGSYNAVAPYWKGQVTDEDTQETQDVVVYLTEVYVKASGVTGDPVVAILDVSGDFQEIPTQNDLRARALQFLNTNKPWIPDDNIKVSFVQLWQTEEYKDVAILQRLSICDQINVFYEKLGVIAQEQEVIRVVYNVLLERYDEMELGKPETSLAKSLSEDAISSFESELEKAKRDAITNSMLQAAIIHATKLITGGLGGHVVFNLNADGQPEEILIMDTDDINTAVNVWRFNLGGLGHSHSGYNGPFSDVALTMDGAINANMITTGTMLANIIKGGTLSLGGANNGNGVMRVYDSTGQEIAALDLNGFVQYGTKHFYPYNGSVYITGDSESPYYDEMLEGSSKNPTSHPTLDWYKRKLKITTGGLVFNKLQTNNSSGALNPPVESTIAGIRANGKGLYMYAATNNYIHLGANSYATYVKIGGTSFTRNIPSSESTSKQMELCAPNGIIAVSPIRYYNSDSCMTELHTSGNNFRIEFRRPTATQYSNLYSDYQFGYTGQFQCESLQVNSTKQRIVKTKNFGVRGLYCYEMPTPMFGDIGEGIIDEEGLCYIHIDPIFAETISDCQYQVFLQKYGDGDCWVCERKPGYFVVQGTVGLMFGWEMKAKQIETDQLRLEKNDDPFDARLSEIDYGNDAAIYYKTLEEGRIGL